MSRKLSKLKKYRPRSRRGRGGNAQSVDVDADPLLASEIEEEQADKPVVVEDQGDNTGGINISDNASSQHQEVYHNADYLSSDEGE